jgi:predicted adenylyl cyclase CyaB
MARNVEIKTRIDDIDAARAAALAAGARPYAIEEQTDRYFVLDGGRRVKLRSFGGGRAELIEYDRPEIDGVRTSEYTVTPVRDDTAGACLVPKGKPLVIVRKRREILMWDNVRIHLDQVDGLGSFLELEAVVDAAHDETRCSEQVASLMRALAIDPSTLLRTSYSELLQGSADQPKSSI